MGTIISTWPQLDISALVYTSFFNTLIMTIFQSAWPQLDISPCYYQSYSVIALTPLCLAAPFYTAPCSCFCLAYHIFFDNVIKTVRRKDIAF